MAARDGHCESQATSDGGAEQVEGFEHAGQHSSSDAVFPSRICAHVTNGGPGVGVKHHAPVVSLRTCFRRASPIRASSLRASARSTSSPRAVSR